MKPVADALVAFFDGRRYSYAYTGEDGIARCPSPDDTPLVKVTATKPHYIPSRNLLGD